MGTTFFIALFVVGIAVVMLAIGIILGHRKEFPSSHIGDSQALRKKGISCARQQMSEAYQHKNLHERL